MTDRQTDRQERIYGLDLYRTLCMFFVIAYHFSFHGNTVVSCAQEVTFNWVVLAIARIFGALCNGGFMLTSGYFLYRKRFRARTVFRLWLEVWFYSVGLGIVCGLLGAGSFTAKGLIKMLFPFTFNQYWFFSTYIVMYLIFPFLNRCINGLSQRQHRAAIVMGIVLVPIFATFTGARWIIGTNSLAIFIVFYFIGAYFNRYDVCVPIQRSAVMVVCCILLEVLSLFAMRLFYDLTGMDDVAYLVWNQNKILPVVTSIALFLFFKQVRVRHTGLLTFLSSSLFGVYLLHEGEGESKVILFRHIFDNSATYATPMLLPQMLFAMCAIFAAGILIDKIRICIFERPFLQIADPILRKIDVVCDGIWEGDA